MSFLERFSRKRKSIGGPPRMSAKQRADQAGYYKEQLGDGGIFLKGATYHGGGLDDPQNAPKLSSQNTNAASVQNNNSSGQSSSIVTAPAPKSNISVMPTVDHHIVGEDEKAYIQEKGIDEADLKDWIKGRSPSAVMDALIGPSVEHLKETWNDWSIEGVKKYQEKILDLMEQAYDTPEYRYAAYGKHYEYHREPSGWEKFKSGAADVGKELLNSAIQAIPAAIMA